MAAAERKSNFKLKKPPHNSSHRASYWGGGGGVHYEDFENNWPRYNGT